MKKYILPFILTLAMSFFLYQKSMSKNYSQLWKNAEIAASEGLPRSSIKVVDKILQKSISEQNITQAVKATIFKIKYQSKINSDDAVGIFSGLESLLSVASKASDKALLHSLLAELYADYYIANSFVVDGRTDLVVNSNVPTDVNLWTKNMFADKISEHLALSVKDESNLLKTPVKNYADLIESFPDTQGIYPTMYDFLTNRAILVSKKMYPHSSVFDFMTALDEGGIKISDLALPTDQFSVLKFPDNGRLIALHYYALHLKSLQSRGLKEAIVFTELDKNDYLSEQLPQYQSEYSIQFLEMLKAQYTAYPFNAEVISKLVLSQNEYRFVDENYQQDTDIVKNNYDLLKLGIEKYGKYERINILKHQLSYITQPWISLTGRDVFYPTNAKQFKLEYRNVFGAELMVEDKNGRVVWQDNLQLSVKYPYLKETTFIDLSLDKVGAYKLRIKFADEDGHTNTDSLSFRISKIASFSRSGPENEIEFYVVDRKTGLPMAEALVTLYDNKYESGRMVYHKLDSVRTDKRGLASVSVKDMSNDIGLSYNVRIADDVSQYNYCQYSYFYPNPDSETSPRDKISLFTDRGIYRPGQTVYYKAVINGYDKNKQPVPVAGRSYNIVFYNANRQVVAEKKLTTNEFGSLAGEFVVPKNELTGYYAIGIEGNDTYLRVEEYKRPKFEVIFDKLDNTYTFGDSVTLKGYARSFSGIKLKDTDVTFEVVRSPMLRWWSNRSSTVITNGKVRTAADGSFLIKYKIPDAEKSKNDVPFLYPNIFKFIATATVTDTNGETQTGSSSIAVGNVSMILSASVPNLIERNSNPYIAITAKNLDDQTIEVQGNYLLYTVFSNDSINEKVASGDFASNNTSELKAVLPKLASGKYLLQLNASDNQGRPVTSKNYFVVYSYDDATPPIETNEWFIDKHAVFDGSKPAEIIIGVSSRDVTVLYDLIKSGKTLKREQFVLSDENKKITIPYTAAFGDKVTAMFTYVVDEKVYQKQIGIAKKTDFKSLILRWNVFRDKVRPGQKEEWSIVVTDKNGKPASAELLASMYDASLDQLFKSPVWNLSAQLDFYSYIAPWSVSGSFGDVNTISTIDPKFLYTPPLEWDTFNWFNFGFNHRRGSFMYDPALMRSSEVVAESSVKIAKEAMASPEMSAQDAGNDYNSPQDVSAPPLQIRSDFAETAFFYPQLRTDDKGETVFVFTVPEANTSWNFRALAYDKALSAGTLEAKVLSGKELMVTPNIPRFLRQGDKAAISTKVSNLSDETINGRVYIEFFDPFTNKAVDINIDNKYRDYSLNAENSESFTWMLDVPQNIEVLGCRIVAESPTFSDGEQHAIPVLSDRVLVTESMPMDLYGNESREFVFEQMLNNKSESLSNYRLTLEYANNPAWYAIQALPAISNPANQDAVNWFASYYSNTLGLFIAKQYPQVTEMIESGLKNATGKDDFVSQLLKNEDLKSLLLQETPWVLDAKTETEQMQRISMLFNLNNASMQAASAIDKLSDLQNGDGGWSWFRGMNSNKGVTLYILYGFSELVNLNAVEYSSDIKLMQMNALKYLDKAIALDFELLKKTNPNWANNLGVSTACLEYLFVRSAYRDIPIAIEAREAERFYTRAAEKNWTGLGVYEKSLLAVVAKRNGNNELMRKLIQSLREHATVGQPMGMYWANNRSSAFMSQSAVTVHTFIMNAFREAEADSKEMDLMKQWLLKQKQTQTWESVHATLDAVYALLSTGTNWFGADATSKIYIGGSLLKQSPQASALGYIRDVWHGNEISDSLGKVLIERTGAGPAWGALYRQYFEDMSSVIGSQDGLLSIDKQYFTEKYNKLIPVDEGNPVRVGDKVTVRLTVKSDIDLDFVTIKDMRPSAFEPESQLSGKKYQDNTVYYQSVNDVSTNLFFDHLPKGTYVFQFSAYADRPGTYSAGITTIQCMYAPQYVSHTSGKRIVVK